MTAPSTRPPLLEVAGAAATRWTPRESGVVAGIGRVDITPDIGSPARNWGASRTQVAGGIHRPLTATVMAIADSDRWRYLMSADLGWWQSMTAYRDVSNRVITALEVDPEDVLLHLTHTHAGPSLSESGGPGDADIAAYRVRLATALSDAARAAREAAQLATITWAYGRSDLAVARDLACGDRDIVGFDPTTSADDTLLVGRLDADGKTIGVIVNYACHPTTLAWENDLISPDYVGAMREVVEGSLRAPCIFLQGASGELSPREQYTEGTHLADRNGRALGHAVVAVIENMGRSSSELRLEGVVESGAPLAVWRRRDAEAPVHSAFRTLDVEVVRRDPMDSEQLARTRNIDPVAAADRARRAEQLVRGYPDGAPATHPVFVWRLGDGVFVAHPGEAYSALQTELRRRHPDVAIVVMNLTNGPGFMYVPTAEAYEHDRYQVWQTLLGPGSLETIIGAADAEIERMLSTVPVRPAWS